MRRLALVLALALAFPAAALAWGGTYTSAADGTPIDIQVSNAYPVDDALPQAWADYLGTLVHGPELATLHVRLMPEQEIRRTCGFGALACYSPAALRMSVSVEDTPGGPTAKSVVAHEYGHHVAASRANVPWRTVDWGTKRWASYMNVCARVADGDLSPGDEGEAYAQNPGEAFAEAYRYLNEQRQGIADPGWTLVDPVLRPDATALRLLEEDVVHPWQTNTLTHHSGSFGFGTVRTFRFATPLDGRFAATLKAPPKYSMTLRAGSSVLATGRSIRTEVCGERTLTLTVERRAGAKGSFTLAVSKP